MIAIIPVLFALAGVLMYALVSNAKLAEIGRLVFFAAFLVIMLESAKHVVKLM